MRFSRRGFLLGLLLAGTVLTARGRANATVVVPVTVEELTRLADDVVVAVPRRASSQWDGGRIVTDYELEVITALKGPLAQGNSLIVRFPGGVVGRIGQVVAGVDGLVVGRSYVLFLSTGVSGLRFLTHLVASVVPVQLDPATGQPQALPAEGLVPGAERPALRMPLERFAALVRAGNAR